MNWADVEWSALPHTLISEWMFLCMWFAQRLYSMLYVQHVFVATATVSETKSDGLIIVLVDDDIQMKNSVRACISIYSPYGIARFKSTIHLNTHTFMSTSYIYIYTTWVAPLTTTLHRNKRYCTKNVCCRRSRRTLRKPWSTYQSNRVWSYMWAEMSARACMHASVNYWGLLKA